MKCAFDNNSCGIKHVFIVRRQITKKNTNGILNRVELIIVMRSSHLPQAVFLPATYRLVTL